MDISGELLASFAGHLFVDPLQPLDQAAFVVIAVAVLPDVLDDLADCAGLPLGWLGRDGRGLLEVGEEGPIEAVEYGEVRLVGEPFAPAGTPPEHLLEEDARLDRPQEDDALEVGDVDACSQQVYGDGDDGLRTVSELADALQRTVDAAGDLLDEGVASTEDVARDVDEAVGVGGMGEVVDGENEGLGQSAIPGLVLEGVALDLLEDFPVRVGGGDPSLDVGRVERALVFEEVELLRTRRGVDDPDVLPLAKKDAVHPDVRLERDDVVVDKVSLAHGTLILVPVDDVPEISCRVVCWRGGETDLHGVEVVEGLAPDR